MTRTTATQMAPPAPGAGGTVLDPLFRRSPRPRRPNGRRPLRAGPSSATPPTLLPLLLLLSALSAPSSPLFLPAAAASAAASDSDASAPSCSADPTSDPDPDLRTMKFDIGYGPEYFDAYVRPDVSTFYGEPPGTRTAAEPVFQGMAGKFVNMSPSRVSVYWDPMDGSPEGMLLANCGPFMAVGTATFPGHRFYLTEREEPSARLAQVDIEEGTTVYYYDPIEVPGDDRLTRKNIEVLTLDEYERYERLVRSRKFSEKYRDFTGRDYLALYPRRRPRHYMWRADRFGQEHWVATRETQFVRMPPEEELRPIGTSAEGRRLDDDAPRLLTEYRDPQSAYLNLTLRVLSCAPRAFEIPKFLSDIEVEHILKLGAGSELELSTTSGGEDDDFDEGREQDDEMAGDSTRTSYNTWVERDRSPVVDAVYRRAADLLRIDEALLRSRGRDEAPDFPYAQDIAESLQLVHYEGGQEYTAHHDFGYGEANDPEQTERYATLLLYLNEGMEGGETSFPRWVNAETGEGLDITPEKGKAILFYSQLPDGNLDDLSQHAALPVTSGEKWLMNLWVHDPYFA